MTILTASNGIIANILMFCYNGEMKKKCSHCNSEEYVKNGSHKDSQRYKCKNCKRCFSDIPPKFPFEIKLKAVKMYLRNGGMRAVGEMFGVNASTILYWVRTFRKHFDTKW